MSIIMVKSSVASSKRQSAKNSVMRNSGFGPVKVVQEGEKRLDLIEQHLMTVAEAMEHYERGLAITAA